MIRWAAAAGVGLVLFVVLGAGAQVSTPATAVAATLDNSHGEIPPLYARLCTSTGARYHLDPAVLCAITWVESKHGTDNHVSSAGAQGPCQFMPGTWATYGKGRDVQDPAACLDAMARYLIAGGAPGDYQAAVFSYNHADWYVRQVLDKAQEYRGQGLAPPLPIGGIRERIVAAAAATLTARTGFSRYSQGGALTADPMPPPGARTDCSQWVRAIYLSVGLPDPGLNTWDQIAHGHQVVNPQPGDLLFTPGEDHVEIYVGGGRTIGHGTPPIDYAPTSAFPNAFYMTYAGVT